MRLRLVPGGSIWRATSVPTFSTQAPSGANIGAVSWLNDTRRTTWPMYSYSKPTHSSLTSRSRPLDPIQNVQPSAKADPHLSLRNKEKCDVEELELVDVRPHFRKLGVHRRSEAARPCSS